MDRTFDLILTFGAVVIGILLLTGNGGIFMKGGKFSSTKSKVRPEKDGEVLGNRTDSGRTCNRN